MTGTQKKKERFSFKYQFNQCRSKNVSQNDLKQSSRVFTYIMKRNICGIFHSKGIKMGHK